MAHRESVIDWHNSKFFCLRGCLIDICGGECAAAIMDRMIDRYNSMKDNGYEGLDPDNGIYMSVERMRNETFRIFAPNTIKQAFKSLLEKGLLTKLNRRGPDNANMFLVNVRAVQSGVDLWTRESASGPPAEKSEIGWSNETQPKNRLVKSDQPVVNSDQPAQDSDPLDDSRLVKSDQPGWLNLTNRLVKSDQPVGQNRPTYIESTYQITDSSTEERETDQEKKCEATQKVTAECEQIGLFPAILLKSDLDKNEDARNQNCSETKAIVSIDNFSSTFHLDREDIDREKHQDSSEDVTVALSTRPPKLDASDKPRTPAEQVEPELGSIYHVVWRWQREIGHFLPKTENEIACKCINQLLKAGYTEDEILTMRRHSPHSWPHLAGNASAVLSEARRKGFREMSLDERARQIEEDLATRFKLSGT